MDYDSLSKKIRELYGLYKSDTLSKYEYDQLKKELLHDGNAPVVERDESKNRISLQNSARKSVFEDRLKVDSLNTKLLLDYAQFLFNNQLYEEAVTACLKILVINEKESVAKELLFNLYLKLSWFQNALESGEQLLAGKPKFIPLLEALAKISIKIRDSKKANEYYDKILSIQSSHPAALYNKACGLLKSNEIDKAFEIFINLYIAGLRDKTTLIYAGIAQAIKGEYKTAIELLSANANRSKQIGIHDIRASLYLTYCLSQSSGDISVISEKYSGIDFQILKSNYHSTDETIAAKVIEHMANRRLSEISTKANHEILIGLIIESFIKHDYLTERSHTIIANIWYAIGKKQLELKLFKPALASFLEAQLIVPDDINFKDQCAKTKKLVEKKAKRKFIRTNLIVVSAVLIIALIFLAIYGLKYLEEKKTFESAKLENTSTAFQTYLKKYPNGRYLAEIKELQEEPIWQETKALNYSIGYDKYLSSYPNGKYIQEAKDSLRSIDVMAKKRYERLEHLNLWDESMARDIVLNELRAYPNWAKANSDFGDNPDIQIVNKFSKIELPNEDVFVCLTFTNISDGYSMGAMRSLFEFRFDKEWVLKRKDFAFTSSYTYDTDPIWNLSLITSNKYVVILNESHGTQGYWSATTALYLPIGDSLRIC
jgi:TolA-binding protein